MTRSNPKVFISYSWDNAQHRKWVRGLATKLRTDGIETILDQWHVSPGDRLPAFMESAIRDSDYVLLVCTPRYKAKADDRSGGVGYEGDIITGELFALGNSRKFIPVLRNDDWKNSAPSWLLPSSYIDLRGKGYGAEQYKKLVSTLHGERTQPPPIGRKRARKANAAFWIDQARQAAEYVNRSHFEAHRGAFLWCPDVTAVFGNDGYDPEADGLVNEAVQAARAEVNQLKKKLLTLKHVELGFGKSKDGYTWVVLVDSDNVSELDSLIWTCYPEGSSNNDLQKSIARSRIWRLQENPFKDTCDS